MKNFIYYTMLFVIGIGLSTIQQPNQIQTQKADFSEDVQKIEILEEKTIDYLEIEKINHEAASRDHQNYCPRFSY